MSYPMNEISEDVTRLAEDAGDCVESAANAARYGAAVALKRGKSIYGIACRRAVNDTRIVDGYMHRNLYQTVLMGMGVGAVLGYLLARRA